MALRGLWVVEVRLVGVGGLLLELNVAGVLRAQLRVTALVVGPLFKFQVSLVAFSLVLIALQRRFDLLTIPLSDWTSNRGGLDTWWPSHHQLRCLLRSRPVRVTIRVPVWLRRLRLISSQ